ncbi:unnamed protein product [Cercopithifilaria johnstoni]|uniref:RNA helicase n=1 Tax=Cercopithifilaria johnstoni TaxID=2874296 RepID=A0A8J2QAD9_9BILA|nr:unnamed protein product [Cercopithifilaria johnstoni]
MRSGEVECSSDTEELYDALKSAQNRKQRHAGGWQTIGLDHMLFKGIQKKGFRQPTPIQRKAIPLIIDGKDIVAMSRTGSGKTAAFVIPILQKLKIRDMKGIRALIIEPTRELAMQTFTVVKELGKFTGLRCAVLVGGDRIEEQFQAVHEKPDIVIATPGRLLHVVVEMDFRLSTVQIIVFDEADRLFEMGFAEQLHEVLRRLPENRQTLLFSATLPKSIIAFSKAGLSDPVLVRLDLAEKISEKLSMVFLHCRADNKLAAFLHLAREVVAASEQTVVFCATMKHVEYLAAIADRAGIDCVVLYSQLDSVARNINIQKFRKKECFLLIVTDIAARGVDIPLLDVAINYHFPPKPKLFIHRVGRVARAGRSGKAISLFGADEVPYLIDLFLFLNRPLKFATTNSVKKDEALIGIFPNGIIDREIDFLKNVHDNSDELDELLKKSENAMQKYKKTRPQPSAESVRRAKDEIKEALFQASVHPFLQQESPEENVRQSFLRDLHNFKSTTTIFEIQSGSKALSAAVMKEKRKAHQNYIQSRTASDKFPDLDRSEIAAPIFEASEDVLKNAFQTVIKSTKFSAVNALVQKKYKGRKRKADELLEEKEKHFIDYAPAEANAERGLAVDHDFNALAKANVIEILADDEVGLYKQEKRKKWDRKLKKFVGGSNGDDSKKKIRTEDGTYLPATYKSGRYERWQKKQKLEYQNNGDEETTDTLIKQHDFRRRNNNRKRRGRNKTGSKEQRAPRSELKTSEQILKQRKKKASIQSYQTYRRQQNMTKKGLAWKRKS